MAYKIPFKKPLSSESIYQTDGKINSRNSGFAIPYNMLLIIRSG